MLDRAVIRTQTDLVREGARRKRVDAPIDSFLAIDAEWRSCLAALEAKRAELNQVSKSIGALFGQGKKDDAEQAKLAAKQISDDIALGEVRERELASEMRSLELQIPNIPHESVPDGASSDDNVEVRAWGAPPTLDQPNTHWDICDKYRLVDFARGTKIAGSGFLLYTGWGARLQRSLINFMIDWQSTRNGYGEVYPPYLVNSASLIGTGQLPKFEDDLYRADEELYLIPTAEVPVTNIYRDEILDGKDLTLKLAAFSGCFRREAGAAGKDTRGMQRVHEFDKVELVKFTKPEDSFEELESLVVDAESVLQALGLHYRVVLICSGDMGYSNVKQYDLEVWSPGLQKYLEISSCSNFGDFQARRANIRFRRAAGDKPELVHTLNGSGLATPRLFASLIETFEQEDGIFIPEPLRPYIGSDRIPLP